MKKIGIDARKYFDYGIGTYIQNLMFEYDKNLDYEFTYFVNDEIKDVVKNIHRGNFISNNSRKYSIGELFSLSKISNKIGIDLFHSPHYTLPFNLKSKVVTTIHDIIHLKFPEYFPIYKREYAKRLIRHDYNKSEYILVNSNYTKLDLINYFNFDENKIIVTYLGFNKVENIEEFDLKEKFGIDKDYILYVGSLKPHKNIPKLFEAYSKIKYLNNVQLVLSGESLNDAKQLKILIDEYKINPIFTGRLEKSKLSYLYKNAKVLVFPSLYEGFGLPPLEAMSTGLPVIASNITSIPEICGDAAIYFDPNNIEQMIYTIENILENEELRKTLIKKGFENIKRFSFEKCANETLNIYGKILK